MKDMYAQQVFGTKALQVLAQLLESIDPCKLLRDELSLDVCMADRAKLSFDVFLFRCSRPGGRSYPGRHPRRSTR
eukprot:2322574-Pleurochrysis_carterae.AAC.1